jgi:hypothetical protein
VNERCETCGGILDLMERLLEEFGKLSPEQQLELRYFWLATSKEFLDRQDDRVS